jgi:CheY-like chemotaxis protein
VSRIPRDILVIDDDLARPDQAAVFAQQCPLESFSYRFVATGKQAVDLMNRAEEIALVLLDIRFEGEGATHGLDILSQLVAGGCVAPILILSSTSEPEVILEAWRRGAKDYIVKRWPDDVESFRRDLAAAVDRYARPWNRPGFEVKAQRREQIRRRVNLLLGRHDQQTLQDMVGQARRFKEEIGAEWRHSLPLPPDHENYVAGWNASEAELERAEREGSLLYLNLDLGRGCTLNCPHCFTVEGDIDERGRKPVPYARLKECMLEAKTLGLKAVRILGTGEPTQWIARDDRDMAEEGDFIDFIRFLRANDIVPLVFTRGQVIGNDKLLRAYYRGAYGIDSGEQLVEALRQVDASVFMGVSSIYPDVNNELVGRGALADYDPWCKKTLRLLVRAGFQTSNPTRFAVESPITTLNIREMPVRYVMFEALNISPCMNVFMVTGRTKTYSLEEIAGPPEAEFLDVYAEIAHFMRRMGIRDRLGPYAGIKECHDVSNGMYLTLNGDLYPCPGYESVQDCVGSIRTHGITEVWRNNPLGRHRQSICPPKISSYFPPDFERRVEVAMQENATRYDDEFDAVCAGLGIPGRPGA